jgi:hypothetical protein
VCSPGRGVVHHQQNVQACVVCVHSCMLQELLHCVKALLKLDKAWMPDRPGHSMYVRPYMFSHEGALGVHRSSASTLAVIMSPVGPYFKSGGYAVQHCSLCRSALRAPLQQRHHTGCHHVTCWPCCKPCWNMLLRTMGALTCHIAAVRQAPGNLFCWECGFMACAEAAAQHCYVDFEFHMC